YRIITTLNKGTKVEVISESNGWSKVNYNGRLGYVYSTYLDEIAPSYTNTTTKTVNTDSLNVRSGPSTSYGVVGSLKRGTKVSVISESNGWSKIIFNNKECYTSSRYLDSGSNSPGDNDTNNGSDTTVKETKEVNTNSLNIRSGPSTSYSKIGSLSKGSKIEVISESNGWSKILYNNKGAYVSSRYLDKISSGNNNNESDTETVKETKQVNTSSLNVRSGPSTSYSKIGSLSKGSKIGVISESNGWSKILYNNKVAYVSSQYLDKISSDSAGDNNSSGSDVVISGPGTINNIQLSYTFEDHLNRQVERVSVGGNVSSGKPATKSDIESKLNPTKIVSANSYGKLQFLRSDRYTDGISA
ncbi:MAG: SH3 domain-containing protein, partial [Peptostreptococcaceae bacterium]